MWINNCHFRKLPSSGNFIVNPDDTDNKIYKKAVITYENYDTDDNNPTIFKVNETYIMMLGSTKRTIKIVAISNANNNLTIETQIVMASSLGDSIVITKNNKIIAYGTITKIFDY